MTADRSPWREDEIGRPLLDLAIEREDWELAAHVLLYGALMALEKMPAEAVEEMLEMMAPEPPAHRRRVGRRGRRGHQRR